MSLQSIMALSIDEESSFQDKSLTQARVKGQMENLRQLIAFYREYPDIFVDQIKGKDCTFNFLHYQRQFLRAVMRHREVYATYPRAYSKSFLSMMALFLRCVLYPNSHLFVTTGGKFIIL